MPNKTVSDTGTDSTTLPKTHSASRALGEFLRLMRSQVRPSVSTKRRRAVGLRREEVAVRAGISVTWYTWLEQGRPVRVSRATMQAIASALELDALQLSHALKLAEQIVAPIESAITTAAPENITRLVDQLLPHAAYAINGLWDVLYANRAAVDLLGAFDRQSATTGNVLRRLFLDPAWTAGFENRSGVVPSAVAQFRAATVERSNDADFHRFVEQLRSESSEFNTLWTRHELSNDPATEKVFNHETRGRLRLSYNSLIPGDAPSDLRIILYTVL